MSVQSHEMIGRKVGDYQVTDVLGEGGMGMVFKGFHPVMGQQVAIKMLHPNLVKSDSIKKRFEREARAMARLRHPNILQILNFVEDTHGCFIIMEFVQGKEFQDVLEEKGLIPPVEAIDMFVPILDAMYFAHSQGVIHRDIKPSNLMQLNTGVCKVLDFGTAKLAGDSGPQLTAAGMTLGTVVYMSPEQLMGRDLSPQADIYSLGVTLYEMTTASLPFYDENEMKLMKMIMKEPPPPPRMAYPGMPPSLEAVILRAIEKERGKRFTDAKEFADALKGVREEIAGPAPVSVGSSSGGHVVPGSDPSVASPHTTPPPMQAVGVEDTQQLQRPGTAAAASTAGGTGAGKVLLIVGASLAGFGAILGGILMGTVSLTAGLIVGASILGIGVVLLIVGLVMQSSGASAPAQQGAPHRPHGAEATQMMQAAPQQQVAPAAPQAPASPHAVPVEEQGRFLKVIEGPIAGHRVELTEHPLSIGRAPDNGLPLPDPAVSSHHARIDFYQGRYFISDLKSSNGTYLNNGRIDQAPLNDGDLLIVGQSRIQIVLR
jgi:tRNA A-37 threonylcarbamoyl transferase component Bud32